MSKLFPVLLFPLFFTGCAEKKPFTTANQINEECTLEMEAARTAVLLRNDGMSRENLSRTLPPLNNNSSRLLFFMHEIVEEVYKYKELNEVIYPTYRFELCSRQLTNKSYPYTITQIYPTLLACQNKFGKKASIDATNCVLSGFQAGNRSEK